MLTVTLLVLTLADPTITSPVGTGEKGFAGDGGPAAKAKLDQPFDVAFDQTGNLYFSDTNNHRVRRVDAKTGITSADREIAQTAIARQTDHRNLGTHV